jgi:uncharacterized phage-like protein YoqJ
MAQRCLLVFLSFTAIYYSISGTLPERRRKMIYRVGVTGHRKLLRNQSDVIKTTKEVFRLICQKYRAIDVGMEVNTGMALGFDQLVCDVCLELDIPYVAVVPCDGQDSVWSRPQRQRYEVLLTKASRIVQVTPGPYEPWKMHARNGWIVNNSDEMVVHWDGFYEGGTGGCMKLVRSKKLPWTNTFNHFVD